MKILIADDQEAMLQMYALMLADYGQIIEARTGKEAIEQAVSEKPEIILLDHNMPEMLGYEVVQRMRNHPDLRLIPILFITGKDFDETMRRIIRMDVQDFISKPFTAAQLIAAMEKALKHPLISSNRNKTAPQAVKEEPVMPSTLLKPAPVKPAPIPLDHSLSPEHETPHLQPEMPPIPLPAPAAAQAKPQTPAYAQEIKQELETQINAVNGLKKQLEAVAQALEELRKKLL